MAIKISYIFLRTLSLTLNANLYACDGFEVNENQPIKAFGNMYFVKENNEILTKTYENITQKNVKLPQNLENINFTKNIEPLYILPAV